MSSAFVLTALGGRILQPGIFFVKEKENWSLIFPPQKISGYKLLVVRNETNIFSLGEYVVDSASFFVYVVDCALNSCVGYQISLRLILGLLTEAFKT